MGRAPCCEKMGLKKGPWTKEEDHILINYINQNGHGNWRALPKQAGLLRCGKSCRLRWTNYLRPGIKRGNFSKEEEDTIFKLHQALGNRWSAIAARLPGRTDNEIKNVWNTHLKKRLRHFPSETKQEEEEQDHRTNTTTTATLVEADSHIFDHYYQDSKLSSPVYDISVLEHHITTINIRRSPPDKDSSGSGDDVSSSTITDASAPATTTLPNTSSSSTTLDLDQDLWPHTINHVYDSGSSDGPELTFTISHGLLGGVDLDYCGFNSSITTQNDMDFWCDLFTTTEL